MYILGEASEYEIVPGQRGVMFIGKNESLVFG